MSALDRFLFDAGMEGFNDPSSIPPVGIVVPFFGVEEFAEADEVSRVVMEDMNRQADAVYKLQETLVYINANRPNFDRGNAEHVIQALGDVQVLMPNMEDPVTIMGSLEHYTPSYSSHLLGHGTESITGMITAAIQKLIELLKKGVGWLVNAMRSASMVLGKQKREVTELSAWLKANKTTAPTVVSVPDNFILISKLSYFYLPGEDKPVTADRIPYEIRRLSRFCRNVNDEFIAKYIMLGRMYLKVINNIDLSQPSSVLFRQTFKGQPVFTIGGRPLSRRSNGDDSLEQADFIGGIGFCAPNVHKKITSPVGLADDGSEQQKYFNLLKNMEQFEFNNGMWMDRNLRFVQPTPCSIQEGIVITDELDSLIDSIITNDISNEVTSFNNEVRATIEMLRRYQLSSVRSNLPNDDYMNTIGFSLFAMANAISRLPYEITREVNNFTNAMREYVTKSVKS